ncbi:MAG: PAS domain-containing protein [Caulobacterales bacterium]
MFHLNTELLIDYWRERRGERALPARADIDPTAFAALAPNVFIVLRQGAGDYRFRLAGEGVHDLHGRALAGENLLLLWRADHRGFLTSALEAAMRAPAPVVVSAEARTRDAIAGRLEILFAPLSGPTGLADRFLGLCQPIAPFEHLDGRTLSDLAIRSVNSGAARRAASSLRLAAVDGRQIA